MSFQISNKVNSFRWLLLSALLGASTAEAAIDISTAPLETGTAVPPNILFLIDDSGSMRWGFMPDDLSTSFSLSSNCTTSSTSSYAGATVRLCRVTNRKFLASSHLNKVYYNPATTYNIPLKPDGVTSYPTPSYTNAPHNGYDTSSSKINLNTEYLALIADYFYPNGTTGFTISSSTSNTNAGGAFYYNFNNTGGCSGSPRSDSCYDLVTLSSQTAAQRQNFANWFSFYRTRLMSSKAGVSAAFQSQGEGIRVGYGSLNSPGVISSDVGSFGGGTRSGFFTWLHNKTGDGGTPLLGALEAAGNYYTQDKAWRTNPSSDNSALLECRQNFTILMTDGYYGDSSGVGNQDGSNGNEITGPNAKSYTYEASNPFKDGNSNTLADIAMKYWKTDLRPDLDNTVPFTGGNPAFWQHMVTFGVGLGVSGSVDPKTAFDAINSGNAVNWWSGTANQNKINDLLHAGVNSRGGFFSADNPSVFAEGLAATLNSIQERVGSASSIAATAINSLQSGSNLYQARYTAGKWGGDLWSFEVDDLNVPAWKASEKLPAPSARNIIVGNGTSSGTNFTWASLTPAQRMALGGNPDIVDYLRGDQSKEKVKGGVFRDRITLIGDLVNSSPELVNEPLDLSYHRYSWDGASSYRAYLEGPAKTRAPMIYVGSNGGMLHAFNSKTGVEVFAFIPTSVMAPLPLETENILKKYADPTYNHRFSVDGSPSVNDVYYDGSWKSIMIGSMGRGGNALFAIDVTNPEAVDGNKVLWDKGFSELGIYLGKPQVHRMETGDWAIIAGYGYNNNTAQSGVLVIDVKTGNILKKLPTDKGSASDPNGMSEVNVMDVDADGNVDWVYGGDMHGHVWKFDLSSSSTGGWKIANEGKPLFSAKDISGNRQMITGGVRSSIDPLTGKSWIFFGTGRYLNADDPSNDQVQTWYGIIDGPEILSRTELAERVMTKAGDYRVISSADELEPGKKGWYIDLIDERERIVDMPRVLGTDLVMNSMTPDTNVCNPSGSGQLMVVSAYVGGRLKGVNGSNNQNNSNNGSSGKPKPFFDVNGDGKINDEDLIESPDPEDGTNKVPPSSMTIDSSNSEPTFTKDGEKIVALVNCGNANVCKEVVNLSRNNGLQSWHEISN